MRLDNAGDPWTTMGNLGTICALPHHKATLHDLGHSRTWDDLSHCADRAFAPQCIYKSHAEKDGGRAAELAIDSDNMAAIVRIRASKAAM